MRRPVHDIQHLLKYAHLSRYIRVQIVASDSPVEIRQAAAVTFKNTVKYRWVGSQLVSGHAHSFNFHNAPDTHGFQPNLLTRNAAGGLKH